LSETDAVNEQKITYLIAVWDSWYKSVVPLCCTAWSRRAGIDLSNISIIVWHTCQFCLWFTLSWTSAASWSTEFQFSCIWQLSAWCWKWVVVCCMQGHINHLGGPIPTKGGALFSYA